MKGKAVCRMHGGAGSGAPIGNLNAFKHGHFRAEAVQGRQTVAALIRRCRELAGRVRDA